MKPSSILLATMLLFSCILASAQNAVSVIPPSSRVAKIGITVGGDIEMPHGLGYKSLLNTAKDVDFDYNTLPFSKGELTSMECDNPTTRLNFAFTPKGLKNAEMQISLLGIEGRIDKVKYEIPETGEHLEVSATNKETAIEAVLLKKDEVGKTWVFYVGGGTNIGYAHDGKVQVKGFVENLDNGPTDPNDTPIDGQNIDKTYEQRNSINQRIFVQASMGIKFLKRMEFGMECRKGLGYRATIDGPFQFTTLKRSLGFSLKYSIF